MINIFTTQSSSGEITYKEDRPVLLLTSTSYTPDEDLNILLLALIDYAKKAVENDKLPRLHLVVTGAGPLKRMFLQKFLYFNK